MMETFKPRAHSKNVSIFFYGFRSVNLNYLIGKYDECNILGREEQTLAIDFGDLYSFRLVVQYFICFTSIFNLFT